MQILTTCIDTFRALSQMWYLSQGMQHHCKFSRDGKWYLTLCMECITCYTMCFDLVLARPQQAPRLFLRPVIDKHLRQARNPPGWGECERIAALHTCAVPSWSAASDDLRKKSISQTRVYWEQRLWANGHPESIMSHFHRLYARGHSVVRNLELALQNMSTMYDIVYTKEPSENKKQAFATAASTLRAALRALDAPATVWAHIWTIHMPHTGMH